MLSVRLVPKSQKQKIPTKFTGDKKKQTIHSTLSLSHNSHWVNVQSSDSIENWARQIPRGWPAFSKQCLAKSKSTRVRIRASVTPQEDSQETPPTLSPSHGSQSPDDNLGKVVTGQKALETSLPYTDGLEPSLADMAQCHPKHNSHSHFVYVGQ